MHVRLSTHWISKKTHNVVTYDRLMNIGLMSLRHPMLYQLQVFYFYHNTK